MESLLATSSVAKASLSRAAFLPPSAVLRSVTVGSGNAAARGVRCASGKDSMFYKLLHDDLFNSVEVIQWESGKSINTIAAAQGIRIRRLCRQSYPSEGTEANLVVPRNILEQIIWDKEVEVSVRKAKNPLEKVMESAQHAPPARDFIGALDTAHRRNGAPALIAEVKKASPSRGVLRDHFNPVEIAHAYENNGAACLSILTDEKHFQGSFENLETVRNSGVKCPLLCKEFVIDTWQIYHARSKGADAILLIAAVLLDLDIKYMLRICRNLGMTAVVELQVQQNQNAVNIKVHDERELDRVLKIDGVKVIGINNRNLETFEVDTANTKMLLEKRGHIIRKKGILVVGESGLFTPEDIKYVHNTGVSAVLVGECLLTQDDPGTAIAELYGKELLR